MANETITTALTTIYRLHLDDKLYISPTGSILFTTSVAAALANNAVADERIDVHVDGSVISVSGAAISLGSSLVSELAEDTITIGEQGVVRSLARQGILLNRSAETIINHGEISGGMTTGTGISATGNFNTITNHGTISGATAIGMIGSNLSVMNAGQISGKVGLRADSALTHITNSGEILSTSGNAVMLNNVITGALYNSGTISSARLVGVQMSLQANTSEVNILNQGRIAGEDAGILITGPDTGPFSPKVLIANEGSIASENDAIVFANTTSASNLRLHNLSGGTITGGVDESAIAFKGFLRIVNHGEISSSGRTSSSDGAIQATSLSTSLILINHGSINGTAKAIDMGLTTLNTGDFRLRNFGDITGEVRGSFSEAFITNRGTMEDITLGEGDDVVRNFGTIDGEVFLGAGDNLFDTRHGLVLGTVQVHDPDNTGDSTLRGGLGDDSFRGSNGNDILVGNDGDDLLEGGLGQDLIRGGEGNDTILADFRFDTPPGAGSSADILIGGAGEDVFKFQNAAYIGNSGTTRDRITDFTPGADVIDLSAFMAGGSFIGSAAFAGGGAVQVRLVSSSPVLQGDVNGDGVGDWQIGLSAGLTLTAANFIF